MRASSPAVLALAAALVIARAASAEEPGLGHGALPLSESIASAWLSDVVEGRPRALLLVFFEGEPGWHDRAWTTEWSFSLEEARPSIFQLVSAEGVLDLRLSADRLTATVQGRELQLAEANVVLVRRADAPAEKQEVVPLGRHEMPPAEDVLPVVAALRANPELARLLAE